MVTLVVPVALGLVSLASAGVFLARAWWHRPGRVDRRRLVSDGVQLALLLVFVRAVLPLGGMLSWAWVVLVAVLAAGVVGAVHGWARLPWAADRRRRDGTVVAGRPGRAVVQSALWLALGAGLSVVLL